MEKWTVKVELKNRDIIETEFPYNADGDEEKEEKEWDDIVSWIFDNHKDVLFYRVQYTES